MSKRLSLVGATALAVLLGLSVVARADTISYADAVSKLAADCGADIKKVCSGLNLGNNAITNCLQKNVATVSPVCTASLSGVISSIRTRQAAQIAYYDVCKRNMATTCKGLKGDGNMLSCLVKADRITGPKCSQAITDAGWR
jgi:hypothetical protein